MIGTPKLGVKVSETSTTQLFPLGTLIEVNGNTYEYVKSTASLAAGLVCGILEDGTIAEGFTHAVGGSGAIPTPLCIPQIAFAANDYGWVARRGKDLTLQANAATANDVKIYTSATAGKIDDNPSSQTLIVGLRLNTATSGAGTVTDASAAVLLYAN